MFKDFSIDVINVSISIVCKAILSIMAFGLGNDFSMLSFLLYIYGGFLTCSWVLEGYHLIQEMVIYIKESFVKFDKEIDAKTKV